jgi:hypothetical protein
MIVDLVQRILYLLSKGEGEQYKQFKAWILNNINEEGNIFNANNKEYYWKIISAKSFENIINDDKTDWLFIYNLNGSFQSISQIHYNSYGTNLIGEQNYLKFGALWILSADIPSLLVDGSPISICNPYFFESPIHRINYDFKCLMQYLHNPKVKIYRNVDYKTHKEFQIRIR